LIRTNGNPSSTSLAILGNDRLILHDLNGFNETDILEEKDNFIVIILCRLPLFFHDFFSLS
jgi:hypothetical protein